MLRYLIARLSEPSTKRGLVNFLTGISTAAGLALKPELAEMIVAAGLSIVGLMGMLLPDKPAAPQEPKE